MKGIITFVFSLTVVLYLGSTAAHAQAKVPGGSRGPSVNQGHSQSGTKDHSTTAPDQHNQAHEPKAETWAPKFDQRIQSDSKFRARIESLLPAGMDLKVAESGFKNQGQFIAALHVSRNLNIPFDQLKAKMLGLDAAGQVTSSPMSLGKAIHALRPDMPESDAIAQAKTGEKQAKATQKTTPST